MTKGTGTLLGVNAEWSLEVSIDENVLLWAMNNLRHNAQMNGCKKFPGRDDIATNPVFFNEVRRMYQIKTGYIFTKEEYPYLRRRILKLGKNKDLRKI